MTKTPKPPKTVETWIEPLDTLEDDSFDDACGECDGYGYVLADCFEDTCCCADPEKEHGYITCPNCGGKS